MRKLSALLAIAGFASLSAPALAQENGSLRANSKGAYVTAGVGGGWSSSPSANYTESGSVLGIPFTLNANGNTSLGGGVAVDAGVGYDFGNSIRGEVTYVLGSYALGDTSFSGNVRADGQSFPITGGNISASGNVSTNSVMFSGYYDFKSKSKFTPYVGGGIGYTSVSIASMPASLTANGVTFNNLTVDGGSGSAFGYQAKLGVSYAVSKPADVFGEVIYQGNTGVTINEVSYGALNAFSVRAGARFRFGS
jgi:opacity protein-like surface antigen